MQVLILATGFRVQDFFAPMQITGKGSTNVLEKWKETQPRMYYGIVSSETPNQFVLLGPNTVSKCVQFQMNKNIKETDDLCSRL